MFIKLIVYLSPVYIGLGFYVNWVINHKEQGLIRKIILFLFLLYGICVINVTFFPLPLDRASLENIKFDMVQKWTVNLIPFRSSMSAKQAVLNFVMMFPLGVMAPIVYKTSKTRRIILILVLTPLSIEFIQGLGSWLMQGRWRQADINDFLLNAAGAIVGFTIYRTIIKLFPSLVPFC